MKTAPFDLAKALSGHPLTTGRHEPVVDFALHPHFKNTVPLLATKYAYTAVVSHELCLVNGFGEVLGHELHHDLLLRLPEPVKHKGFVNIYKITNGKKVTDYVFDTEEQAKQDQKRMGTIPTIATAVPIEWEE